MTFAEITRPRPLVPLFGRIEEALDRSLGLLPRLATGRLNDAMTWLHTVPKPATPATGPDKDTP